MSTDSASRYRETYETRFGHGQLFWEGGQLVAHTLPEEGSCPQSGDGPGNGRGSPAARLLQYYFEGGRVDFSELRVCRKQESEFGAALARALKAVGHGSTVSYAELASAAGYPGAQRAVGTWLARNPLPVIVPCHRVIRADGSIGRFSAGEGWKRKLLQLEGIYPSR